MRPASYATDLRKRVGQNIRRLRNDRGWAQDVLGEHAELTQVYLSRVENGRVSCTLDVLAAIARALEVEPIVLLEQ